MIERNVGFREWLTKDALVDSVAYVCAISQKELDRIKQQAPYKSGKLMTLLIFKNK